MGTVLDQLPHPAIAGDPNDNDATILNSLVEDHAAPPDAKHEPITPKTPDINRKAITRQVTGTLILDKTWSPVLLLPSDPNRVSLRMWAASATASDYLRFADDNGKVQSVGSSALLYVGQPMPSSTHTGPVWVYAPDGVGPVTVSFVAVTN